MHIWKGLIHAQLHAVQVHNKQGVFAAFKSQLYGNDGCTVCIIQKCVCNEGDQKIFLLFCIWNGTVFGMALLHVVERSKMKQFLAFSETFINIVRKY